jgi:hypothetical protein
MSSVEAFGYEYSLTVGRPDALINSGVPFVDLSSAVVVATASKPTSPSSVGGQNSNKEDYRTVPVRFFEVVDKQLEANIQNTKDNDNPTKISVYNLTPNQLNLVKENSSVVLRGGYATEIGPGLDRTKLPMLYVGQVISTTTIDDGVNKITEILCSSSRTPMKNIKLSISWPPGTTWLDMVFDLIDITNQAGIPVGNVVGDVERRTIINDPAPDGYQLSGLLGEEFLKLLQSVGYRMYMVLGKIHIEPIYADPDVEVINIKSENIKGTINKEEDGSVGLSGDGQERVGIKLKTFLNGNITTNKMLRLTELLNKEFEGDYKINSVEHVMNYEGDVWDTEISAVRVK